MEIHFIGIGGIGMSALARYFKFMGHNVGGSDVASSEITRDLINEGFQVKLGNHKSGNLGQNVNLVVYSAAITSENIELKKAKQLNILTKRYSTVIGELTQQHYSICVAGTHGKSTTTAMLSLILIKAGFNPNVILGTKLKEFGNSNFYSGGSNNLQSTDGKPMFICESDEWSGSFLDYHPDIAVITNIDKEHLDYYKNIKNLTSAFEKFARNIKKGGVIVLNQDDDRAQKISEALSDRKDIRKFFYSRHHKDNPKIEKILGIPGEHNRSNALGAWRVSGILGVNDGQIEKSLSQYDGSWRRLDTIYKNIGDQEIILINDYAHHPTEIRATLQAVKEKYKNKEIWIVFQPHQKQRTHYLFKDFMGAFDGSDHLILTDVYEVAGREKKKINIGSKEIYLSIKKHWRENEINNQIFYLRKFDEIADHIKKHMKSNTVLIIMGAGNIFELNSYL